jgi:phage-related holin
MVRATLSAAEGQFIGGILVGGITAAVVDIVPALVSVLVLVTVDFGTGIWAALKNKVKIESHKMRKTAYKLLAYLTLIVLGAIIDGGIGFNLNLGTFVAGYCALVESASIVENFGKITGQDAFEKLREMIGNKRDNLKM